MIAWDEGAFSFHHGGDVDPPRLPNMQNVCWEPGVFDERRKALPLRRKVCRSRATRSRETEQNGGATGGWRSRRRSSPPQLSPHPRPGETLRCRGAGGPIDE